MAAEIESKFGIEPELIRAADGKFEVVADGRLIYSKLAVGRFPHDDEVLDELEKMVAQ